MIFDTLLLVLTLILIGYLMRRSSWFPDNTATVLNSFVLNVSLPAIILWSVPSVPMSGDIAYPIIIHWIAILVHVAFILLAKKIFKLSYSVTGALIIVSTLGNTAFLGIPLTQKFFGDGALPFAVLYDQLGSGIGFIIYGAFVLPLFTSSKRQNLQDVFKMLITFPAFLALVLGFLVKLTPGYPEIINSILLQISATLIPCAMIAVGFDMKFILPKKTMSPLILGLALKLLILPFCILFLVKAMSLSGVAVNTSVLQSGMPPMITAGAMATAARLENELSVALVGYGLILSFATVSLIKYCI